MSNLGGRLQEVLQALGRPRKRSLDCVRYLAVG